MSRPVNVVVGNLMSVSTGPKQAARILDAYLAENADVYLFCEAADIRIANLVDGDHWAVTQYGRLGSPESGTAIVMRRNRFTTLRTNLTVGSEATREGGGIRTRYVTSVRVKDGWRRHTFRAGHAAPQRAPQAQRRMLTVLRSLTGVRGGDLNWPHPKVVAWFVRPAVRSVGVLSLVVPRRYRAGLAVPIPRSRLAGADHAGVSVRLR